MCIRQSISSVKGMSCSSDGKGKDKIKITLEQVPPSSKAALPYLLYTRAFTFHFTSSRSAWAYKFRKAADPEDTRDSREIKVII